MESILQKDRGRCFLCHQNENGDHLDKHHVFFGPNRKKSEQYGLTVYLHHSRCHIFERSAVHADAEKCHQLQAYAQEKAMERYGWTTEDFIRIFGRNYT